jgi:hypothetical protein
MQLLTDGCGNGGVPAGWEDKCVELVRLQGSVDTLCPTQFVIESECLVVGRIVSCGVLRRQKTGRSMSELAVESGVSSHID